MRIDDLRHLAALQRVARDDHSWYRIAAANGADEATVWLYDEISWYWGITADQFARDVAGLDVSKINLRVNSPGGDVFDGIAIYNVLRTHKAEVYVTVDGMAASIASVISMAGDTIEMGPGAQMMIHDPHGIVMGEADEVRAYADLLDRTATEIAGFYQRRAGGTVEEWQAAMDATTWYNGPEAVAAGLADVSVGDAPDPAEQENVRRAAMSALRLTGLARPVEQESRSAALRARHAARKPNGGK